MMPSDEDEHTKLIIHTNKDYGNEDDTPLLTEDQINECFSRVLDPKLYPEAISILNQYLERKLISSIFFKTIFSLLKNFNILYQNKEFQDPNHINSIIDLFFHLVESDLKLSDELIIRDIHQIFYPFIQQPITLQLFDQLLIQNEPPGELRYKEKLPTDHDERQIAYEKISTKEGYNSVAHFCIENDISSKLLEILNTPENMLDVLKVVRTFGEYFFTFKSFIPLFDPILNIIYNCEDTEIRSYAIDSISTFSGSSSEAQNFFVNKKEFIQLFTREELDDPPEISTALLFCAYNVMQISEYLDNRNAFIFLNFALQFLNENDSNDLRLAIKVISEGTKKGSEYTSFCLEKGVVNQLFQMINKGLVSFKTQSLIFIAICRFFEFADLESAKIMFDMDFLNFLAEYLQMISSDNEDAMIAALDALEHAVRLAQQYPEVGEWYDLIFNNDEIIKAIEVYDCGPGNVDPDLPESVETYAYSFLLLRNDNIDYM